MFSGDGREGSASQQASKPARRCCSSGYLSGHNPPASAGMAIQIQLWLKLASWANGMNPIHKTLR